MAFVTNTLAPQQKQEQDEGTTSEQPRQSTADSDATIPADESQKPAAGGGLISGLSNTAQAGLTSSFNAVQTGVSSSLKTAHTGITATATTTADLAKGGAQLASDTARAGASIGQSVAKSGLDFGVGVVGGTADLAGTAIGGIVNTAAETSGKVLEPVGSGLKAIQGFGELGAAQGMQKINGLLVAAVQNVGNLTMQALNVSGKAPTFFDPDGDGQVSVGDTIKGLIVLGLDEKSSKYAAYALHAVFSYPTGTAWVPTDTNLPITIPNMSRTRWGRDWGQFSRMDWVQDVDINQFFASSDDMTWQEKFTKGRQYFGVLLLIFEWGTTWPFIMPDMPVEQIPFKDEIGQVVRTLILPTIFANLQRVREGSIDAGSEPPAKEAPKGPEDA